MYIVSKFHDYYDTAAIHGIDKTCVYQRTEKNITYQWYHATNSDYFVIGPSKTKIPLPRMSREDKVLTRDASYDFQKWVVGFCGKLYPLVRAAKLIGTGYEYSYLYSRQEVLDYIASEQIEKRKKKSNRYSYWGDYAVFSEQGMSNFFDEKSWSQLELIFQEFRTPVFVCGYLDSQTKQVLKMNPNLKSLGFMKVKDAPSAFQDIYMYLSGVLGAPPQPKEKMSDKVMAAAKGHDGEYSFKKPPGGKRWR